MLLCQGAPVAQLVNASDWYSEDPGFNPQLGPVFSYGISLLSQKVYHLLKSLQSDVDCVV